jgi:hypothetical protein
MSHIKILAAAGKFLKTVASMHLSIRNTMIMKDTPTGTKGNKKRSFIVTR